MPSVSTPQKHLMAAVAHGWHKPGGGGPSVEVAKEFNRADAAKDSRNYAKGGLVNGPVKKEFDNNSRDNGGKFQTKWG